MASARHTGTATARELERLRDERAVEILDGYVVDKAQPAAEHGMAQMGLGEQLFGPFHRKPGGSLPGGWWLATEVEVEYEPHQVPRHDAVGWRRDRVPERPTGIPVKVRPDWVCEILSSSNAANDTVKKLQVLQRHEVPHYWLLDPERATLTVLRWTPDGYLTALTAAGDDVVRAPPFEAVDLHLWPSLRPRVGPTQPASALGTAPPPSPRRWEPTCGSIGRAARADRATTAGTCAGSTSRAHPYHSLTTENHPTPRRPERPGRN